MRRLFLPALALLGGCMYQVGGLMEVQKVRLKMLDTHSERRLHEFDLTEAIARELRGRGVMVNAPSAEHELQGEILAVREPAMVVSGLDAPIVGSIAVHLRIRLVHSDTGKVLLQEERLETAQFTEARGESTETARRRVFDRLARWVATKLETDW